VDVIAERTHEVTLEGAVLAEGVQRTRLEGFRIHSADGIRIQDGDVTLSRNEVSGSRGPGVEFRGSSRSTLLACWIHDNKGPGVAILDSALATIESNVISANGVQPRALRPGLIVSSSLRPKITGNTFLANGADAIWLSQPDETILERNFFGATTGKPIHVRVLSSTEVARELR
jgi:parallel beta-helix repeat protein